jgi:hypothetical protein
MERKRGADGRGRRMKENDKKINSSRILGLNLERVSDITHFKEILKSLMHGANPDFSLKFGENFKLVGSPRPVFLLPKRQDYNTRQ